MEWEIEISNNQFILTQILYHRCLWSTKLMIPDGVDVTYRYVVCVFVPPNPYEAAATDDKIVVRRWETNLKPRKISCHG